MKLNSRELATVLAGLRYWQTDPTQRDANTMKMEIMDIARNEGSLEPLTEDEIDDLCERLNCEDDSPKIAVCCTCGSENVNADAYAEWCPVEQQWVLSGEPFDEGAVCEDCGGETRIKFVPLTERKPA